MKFRLVLTGYSGRLCDAAEWKYRMRFNEREKNKVFLFDTNSHATVWLCRDSDATVVSMNGFLQHYLTSNRPLFVILRSLTDILRHSISIDINRWLGYTKRNWVILASTALDVAAMP